MANNGDKETVTKTMLNEAVDAILDGMEKMIGGVRGEVIGLREEMNSRFESLEAKVNNNHNELKDEMDGLKADLSTTASRSDLEELRSKLN